MDAAPPSTASELPKCNHPVKVITVRTNRAVRPELQAYPQDFPFLLDAFRERCWAHATLVREGLFDLITSVDILQASAIDQGLVAQYGQDAIQAGARLWGRAMMDRRVTSPSTAPWMTDPQFGGMSETAAFNSWFGTIQARLKEVETPKEQEEHKPAPLPWLDMSNWDKTPVPERKWAIRDRVPLNQCGLFSGEGGTGKSIIELMKNVAHVAGKDWLGALPEPGPAFYLAGEDEKDEIHIRLAAIAKHYGVTFAELIEGGLHVLPLLGEDMTLCAPSAKGGKIETTALYRQIYEAAGDIKPKNISVDTLSRAFAGSEIDRAQVYAFAMFMHRSSPRWRAAA
jgi:hypothetical protein